MRSIQRALTTRTIVAAERRYLTSSTYIATSFRHRSNPCAHIRWQSTKPEPSQGDQKDQPGLNTQLATVLQQSDTSDLVSEVNIPPDPNGILPPDHPALSILGQSSLVIARQLELSNVLIGFEQANRYIIMDGEGETVGYIAERDHGIGRTITRQMARTHRSFTTYIFDRDQKEVLRIHRPFSYINTKIRIYDPIPEGGYESSESTDLTASQRSGGQAFVENGRVSQLKLEEMRIIGECHSQWTALRRKYNLFTYRSSASDDNATLESTQEQTIEARMAQFSLIDEPMLSWDFSVQEEDGTVIGNVNRAFRGFAREIFTDTGVYALRMDAAARTSALENAQGQEIERYEAHGLTLDQRAVMVATAVSIDFDYFSKSSTSGPGFMPIFWPMGGAAEGGAAAGAGAAAGEAGVGIGAAEGAAGAIGAAGRGAAGAGVGALEGGIAGAGTMAGYEAMQRGAQDNQANVDDAGPQATQPPPDADAVEQSENQPGQDDVWGVDRDPWESVGDAGEEGVKGWIETITDWFT